MSSKEEGVPVRRSERQQKQRRSYSPELIKRTNLSKKSKANSSYSERCLQLFEKKTESSYCCSKCKSAFIVSPYRKLKRKIERPSYARYCVDPESNATLPLCNRCGLAAVAEKVKKSKRQQKVVSSAEKEKYFEEAKAFSQSLVDMLHDKDAERLFCPEFKTKPCGCLQKFVLGEGNVEQSRERALELLKLLKEAKQLSKQKFHKNQDSSKPMAKPVVGKAPRSTIGLGNGQKRSRQFEAFVLKQRKILREELKFCERAAQKVLVYSNNFLHKKLRTEPERVQRVERKKGKAMLGLLKPIAEIATEVCCKDNCVLIALSHGRLLQQWRERASLGQAEARRVLAEMLTPSGGIRTNCYKFISLVTGCSRSTIVKVNEQMRLTGGDREPPEHGLKKFWQAQAKKQADKSDKPQTGEDNTLTLLCETLMPSNSNPTDVSTDAPLLAESLQPLSAAERTAEQEVPSGNAGRNISKEAVVEPVQSTQGKNKIWKIQEIAPKATEAAQGNVTSQHILPLIQNTVQGVEQHQISFTLPLSNMATLDTSTQPFLSQQYSLFNHQIMNIQAQAVFQGEMLDSNVLDYCHLKVIVDGIKATQLLSNIGNVFMLQPHVIQSQDNSSIHEIMKPQEVSIKWLA